MCALASARRLYPKQSRFLIVSLGTGETQREIPYKEAKDWGLIGWARPLLYVIFDGVADAVHYQMSQEFKNRDYFRFQIDLSNDFDDENAPNDDMDDARPENIQKIEGVAEELMRRERKNLDRLVNQLMTLGKNHHCNGNASCVHTSRFEKPSHIESERRSIFNKYFTSNKAILGEM